MGWREETSARVKEKKAGNSYTMDPGDNTFRIMPHKKGSNFRPYIEFRIHRDVGPEKQWVMCGKNIRGEGKCWVCDKLIVDLESSQSEQKRAMAKKMRPQDQLLLQVSPLDAKTRKFLAPKAYWAPYSGGKSLGVAILARLGDVHRTAIDDPKKGRNLTVERTGQLLKTRYGTLLVDEEPSEVPANILSMIKPIEDLLPKYNPKRQLAAWKGEKFQDDAPAAVQEEHGGEGEEDYQLEDTTGDVAVEGEEGLEQTEEPEGGYDLSGEDVPLEGTEGLDDYGVDTELEPDPAETLPEDELGEFGEGFDDLPPVEEELPAEEPPPPPAPRRQAAPPARPAAAAQPARRAAPPAAPAARQPQRQAAPPTRPAARPPAAAPAPARRSAPPAARPAPKGGGKPARGR